MKKYLEALIFITVITISIFFYELGLFYEFDNTLQDVLYYTPSITSPDIYVIGIDDKTLENKDITENEDGTLNYNEGGLGPFQTWTREDIASIINAFNQDEDTRPAVIGVDILIAGETLPEYDQALVDACEEGGNVVMASIANYGTSLDTETLEITNSIERFDIPFDDLLNVVDIGHINSVIDPDGIVRKNIYSIGNEKREIISFPYVIANKYNEFWGATEDLPLPPVDKNNQWYIPYYGVPGDYYGSNHDGTSVIRVVRGDFDPAMFAGSIVLIGPYTLGMMDSYSTPMSANFQMHGVEIHANAVQALLESEFKVKVSNLVEIVIIILFALFCYLISKKLDLLYSVPIIILMLVGYVYICSYCYDLGYIVTIAYPVLTCLFIYILRVAEKFLYERSEKQNIKNTFKKYVDPKLVDSLISSNDNRNATDLSIGAKKDIAVLFVDIRGFTPMSEHLKDSPDVLVAILNQYLELTSSSVFNNGGSVDKFIGDATMALFNGFVPLEDYEYKALCAAFDIVNGSEELNMHIKRRYGIEIGFGVGVNCGDAIVGDLGTQFRKDFTAIGDTVNTAARLESNAAAGTVLIGTPMYERLKDRIEVISMGEIPLKGKSENLTVYEVTKILG